MERIKTYVRRWPKIYALIKGIILPLVPILRGPLGLIRYHYALIAGKPYFGSLFMARQLWSNRAPVMRGILEKEISRLKPKEFKILEIGSWAGSSAMLWHRVLREHGVSGAIYCVDHWEAAPNAPKVMRRAAKRNRIFKLFLHNMKSVGAENSVFPLKGPSDAFGSVFQSKTFDFAYIDGDHAYEQFKRDLVNFSGAVKVGGIVCGDDLELGIGEVDREYARAHREEDVVADPRTGKNFHPGINVALGELFGDVSMREGFWAMRRMETGWEKVEL